MGRHKFDFNKATTVKRNLPMIKWALKRNANSSELFIGKSYESFAGIIICIIHINKPQRNGFSRRFLCLFFFNRNFTFTLGILSKSHYKRKHLKLATLKFM